jgi:hypothetical protein
VRLARALLGAAAVLGAYALARSHVRAVAIVSVAHLPAAQMTTVAVAYSSSGWDAPRIAQTRDSETPAAPATVR